MHFTKLHGREGVFAFLFLCINNKRGEEGWDISSINTSSEREGEASVLVKHFSLFILKFSSSKTTLFSLQTFTPSLFKEGRVSFGSLLLVLLDSSNLSVKTYKIFSLYFFISFSSSVTNMK